MQAPLKAILCGAILCVVVGAVVGKFALHPEKIAFDSLESVADRSDAVPNSDSSDVVIADAGHLAPPFFSNRGADAPRSPNIQPSGGPRLNPQESARETGTNSGPKLLLPPSISKTAPVPEQLDAPEHASPIHRPNPPLDALTRGLIKQELPNASAEERDVWFEELKGMPQEKIRELLRLRRIFGSLSPFKLSKRPQATPSEPGQRTVDPFVPLPPGPLPPEEVESTRHFGPADFQRMAISRLQPTLSAILLAHSVILNNIANANTVGFKRSRVLFEDLPYDHIGAAGSVGSQGQSPPLRIAVGLGVQVTEARIDHSSGSLRRTGGELDLAILGRGFFQVQVGSQILYTRNGALTLDASGQVELVSGGRGRLLEPALQVPADAETIQISPDGTVSVKTAGMSEFTEVGRIQIARFANPSGLQQQGATLFAATDTAGEPCVGEPGSQGRGTLKQGFLETSNVKLRREVDRLKNLQRQLQAITEALTLLSPDRPSAPFVREARNPSSASRRGKRVTPGQKDSIPAPALKPHLSPPAPCSRTQSRRRITSHE